jgi:hypothetical protein
MEYLLLCSRTSAIFLLICHVMVKYKPSNIEYTILSWARRALLTRDSTEPCFACLRFDRCRSRIYVERKYCCQVGSIFVHRTLAVSCLRFDGM